MSRRDQVQLGGELVGLGSLAVHEPAAGQPRVLAAFRELLQALLNRAEVRDGQPVLARRLVGGLDVGVQRVQRVDVVKRGELVEPQDVAVHELGTLDEVAHVARALGVLDAVGLLGRVDGRVSLRDRAHAADALGNHGRVGWLAAFLNQLQAAEQPAGNPCLGDLAALDFHLHAQVAFDAVHRVDDRVLRHSYSPPFAPSATGALSASASLSAAASSTSAAFTTVSPETRPCLAYHARSVS